MSTGIRKQHKTHIAEEAVRQNASAGVEPVDDRICILLDGGRKDDERVPAGNCPQKKVDKRPLVNVVQHCLSTEDDLDHLPGVCRMTKAKEASGWLHGARRRMDERLVEVEDERLGHASGGWPRWRGAFLGATQGEQ